MLEAADGAQAAGWPAFHKSKVHASPLLYDVDGDGVQDILVATYDGQILAFRDTVRACPSCANTLVVPAEAPFFRSPNRFSEPVLLMCPERRTLWARCTSRPHMLPYVMDMHDASTCFTVAASNVVAA